MFLPLVALLMGGQGQVPACPATVAIPVALSGRTTTVGTPGVGKRFTVTGSQTVAGLTAEETARGGGAAIVQIRIPKSGTYSIALGDRAWIDVRQAGKTLDSVGHEHGPACTGIRKIVRFALAAGPVELRLSGMNGAAITVLVARDGMSPSAKRD